MYEDFFGFSDCPFIATPSAQRFFPASSIQSARETALRCIRRAEGTTVVIGPVGTGKTILCQSLAQELCEEFQIALLESGRLCTRRALLQSLLYELGLPYQQMDEGELRLALRHHLDTCETEPRDVLLIVDEADTLPIRLIEEVRVLTNSTAGGGQPIRLLLSGGPRLEERLASPKLDTFSQRISARCYLDSMGREETAEYMSAQLNYVGVSLESVFTPDACLAVYRATDGIARLINQVCNHALVLGFSAGRRTLETADIDIAWADLQQLPAPVAAPDQQSPGQSNSFVEFGELDDGEDEHGVLDNVVLDEVVLDEVVLDEVSDISHSAEMADEPCDDHAASVPFPVVRPDAFDELEIDGIEADEPAFDEAEIDEIVSDEPVPEKTEWDSFVGPTDKTALQDNPFDESFQSEEVLIDRYASLGREILNGKPRVKSQLGRELTASLAGYSIEDVCPGESVKITPVQDAAPVGVYELSGSMFDDFVPAGPATESGHSAEGFALETSSAASDPVIPEPIAAHASLDTPNGTIPVGVSPAEDPVFPEDDLIVIEDDEPTANAEQDEALAKESTATKPRVRRQQYRQLFANLQG